MNKNSLTKDYADFSTVTYIVNILRNDYLLFRCRLIFSLNILGNSLHICIMLTLPKAASRIVPLYLFRVLKPVAGLKEFPPRIKLHSLISVLYC